MCKYANQCELYDDEFCGTVNEPEKEWPCHGTTGLRGQIMPTQDYKKLVRDELEAKKVILNKAGVRVYYADGQEVQLIYECNIVCESRTFHDCNDDKALCEWIDEYFEASK